MSERRSKNQTKRRTPLAVRAATAGPRGIWAPTLLLAAILVLSLALASRAEALIYWTESLRGTGAIWRANLDGTGVEQNFITHEEGPNEVILGPNGVAVDAGHIYWSEQHLIPDAYVGSIGRANLDGTGVDNRFITGGSGGIGLAVDAQHVYWANWGDPGTSSIGRANLDGTGVDQDFITGLSMPTGVAVDDAHIYWANSQTHSIGRANLDGTDVDTGFITGVENPEGVAVDASHIYWGRFVEDAIGRANLDGTGVEESFITLTLPTADFVEGVAVDDAHVYWTTSGSTPGRPDTIGRANLDGTGVEEGFISGVNNPQGVAVDSLALVSLVKVNKNEERGTATITAKVPEPGELRLARNRKVKGAQKVADAAGKERLRVKPRGKAKKKLNEKGTAKVRARITYTPDGGEPDTESKRIKLVKR